MTTALLVIDMQNDFFDDPDLDRHRGSLVDACNLLIRRARDAGAPVLEVQTVHAHDKSTWALNMREDDQGMALAGSQGVQRVPGLEPGDVVIEKTRDSAFHRTGLLEELRRLQVRSLVLCGVSTESCIAMTGADGYAWDFYVTLVTDATASPDPAMHREILDRLGTLYRQQAVPAAEVDFTSDAPRP